MAAAINFARKQTVFYKSLNLLCAAAQDKKFQFLFIFSLHNDNLPKEMSLLPSLPHTVGPYAVQSKAFHSLLDFTVWINKDHKKDIFENE